MFERLNAIPWTYLDHAYGSAAEVPEMLDALLSGIRDILSDNLVGVYLRGSLALGDFDPAASDLDFFAVTERRVSDAEFSALAALHTRLDHLPNRYAAELEGPYIDRAAARRFQHGQRHPTIARGESLTWYEHGSNWVLERWAVREHGLTLLGPDPKTLIDPVTPTDIRKAVRHRLPDWAAWANQHDNPDWHSSRGHKAYVVETMCRALCTLATDELPSKPQAVAWALANLPEPWRATVERSRVWQNDKTSDSTIAPEVWAFVLWATAQADNAELHRLW
ncbi:MAG: aminoglycoside adenylyltransferase domain-containing protein [Ktedonobacterales bacterium]